MDTNARETWPLFLRAFSAGAFFCNIPKAPRLALGYKYFTATRFPDGLSSGAALHSTTLSE